MEVKLYVGNLSYNTTEENVRELFSQAGNVASVALIKDRTTGQSKGFAFVEMLSKEEGQAAIAGLNGKDLKGRSINVNEARARQDSGGRSRRPGGGLRDRW